MYREAPFKVRVKIATHLKDSGLLKTLSKQAANRNNYREAYDLWLSSGAGMDSKYLIKLKRALIEDGIKKDNGYIFLDESDRIGNLMAFEALMQASQQSSNFLPRAYETARKIRDETLTQRARKAIVDISPRLALRMFKGFEKEKVEDPAGVDYVLSVVAQNTGSNPTLLKELVGKYSPE
ncbi:MAG: hypothetical protein NT076_05815 [Candidatus Pacearchaeota archaeon]|nr:hypothetical protein [Candidatus Pacearchaeota archaeon]